MAKLTEADIANMERHFLSGLRMGIYTAAADNVPGRPPLATQEQLAKEVTDTFFAEVRRLVAAEPPAFDPTTHLATYSPEEMRQLFVGVVATTTGASLWSMLPPAEAHKLLDTAPSIYGPWHPGDAADVEWQRTSCEEPYLATVCLGRHGLWYWEGCGGDGDEYATADVAKAACDAHLRACGIVLVDT